jgi:large subunit ribosomal protein L2
MSTIYIHTYACVLLNSSCNIALVTYPNGQMTYIIAPQELKIGDTVLASRKNEVIHPTFTLLNDQSPNDRMIHVHVLY